MNSNPLVMGLVVAVTAAVGIAMVTWWTEGTCASVVLTDPNGAMPMLTAPDVRRANSGWELHGEVELRTQGKQGSIGKDANADSHLWVSDDAVQFVYFAEHLCKES